MPYSDFTLQNLKESFDLFVRRQDLLPTVQPMQMSDILRDDLAVAEKMLIRTKKAKSEWIVTPILKELLRNNGTTFEVYSGEMLIADKESGLVGECDFILGKNLPHRIDIAFPLLILVVAPNNDIDQAIAECTAQMIGASLYNTQAGDDLPIWGCVTNADVWHFMQYKSLDLVIDHRKFYFSEIETVLGVFQYILDYYRLELQKLAS